MYNLRLLGAPCETAEDVVGWLGAVQSQDYGPAKWSVGQRTVGVGDAAIDRAFADGAILRTHVLRPTWHFVLPADIRWLLEATAARVHALNAYQYSELGLDNAVLERCGALLAEELRGGKYLTRNEVQLVLGRAGIAAEGRRLGYILMNAELNGLICSGAPKGKQHTHALLNERAPHATRLSHEEALAELTLRYFTSHGPATAKDLQGWASLTMADVRRGLEMVSSRLQQEVIDGLSYWFAPSAPHPEPISPEVHMLQGYDEYIRGYSQSRHVLDISGVARAGLQDRASFVGVLLLDGQVAGHWKRTLKRDCVLVEAALYAPFDTAQTRALQAAVEKHGRFLGLAASVTTTQI